MKQTINAFDFSRVGKQMPYRVPEGYMEHQRQVLMVSVQSHPVMRKPILNRLWIWCAAACALILLAIYPAIQLVNRATDMTPVYCQTTTTTTDDWEDFAEADIFLENMNW